MTSKALTQKLLSFAEREINVFAGDHAGRNLEASLKQAKLLTNLYRRVYYLSTVHNPWSLKRMIRNIFGESATGQWRRFEFACSLDGKIGKKFETLKEEVIAAKTSILIINSWEFTSRNHRLREELIYSLKQLVAERDITLIVWTQRGAICEAGEWRYGIGKIGALAAHVEHFLTDKEERETAPSPAETVPQGGALKLFAEYQTLDPITGEPIPQEPPADVDDEKKGPISEEVAISPVGALVRMADFDPWRFDATHVCASVADRDYKNLRGENWCPWEGIDDDQALAIMPHVGDPFSPLFAPYYWAAALCRMREEPSACPPLPNVWHHAYNQSVWFRDLVRQAGFESAEELDDTNLKSYREYKPKKKGQEAKDVKGQEADSQETELFELSG